MLVGSMLDQQEVLLQLMQLLLYSHEQFQQCAQGVCNKTGTHQLAIHNATTA